MTKYKMSKKKYIFFHLISILRLQKNDLAKKQINENLRKISRKQIKIFYLAVTGRIRCKHKNSLELIKLYKRVFKKNVVQTLTPSQEACFWQGKFEYGKLFLGYIERDCYKDINFEKGQHLFALVSATNCKTPQYFFDEKELSTIKIGTAMDAYALLQLNPYWTDGYGARTIINEYEVIQEFIGAKGYALNNHHLSREVTSERALSNTEKTEKGIGKHHIELDPYDEHHCEYEYKLPPSMQIYVPQNQLVALKLYASNIFQLKDDMRNYKKLYKQAILKAQNNRLKYLYDKYIENKMFNDLL